jgi:hypothetical protein
MSLGATTVLELPLDGDVWNLLRDEAARSGRETVSLVGDVVTNWVRDRQRQRVAQEIAEFASAYAGTELDLDRELEAASLQTLGDEVQ